MTAPHDKNGREIKRGSMVYDGEVGRVVAITEDSIVVAWNSERGTTTERPETLEVV